MSLQKHKLLGDISNLHYGGQEYAVGHYLNSLLYGELREHLEEKGVKVFKGISKEFIKKYMLKFNKMLKLNNYSTQEFNNAFEIEYDGKIAIEYIAFFVFQNGKGNAFGSFPSAYIFANEMYLFNHIILGNAIIQLGQNTEVKFGRVVIQDGALVECDLEKVVNNDFYKSLLKS